MANPVANVKVTQAWGKPNPRYQAKRHTGIDFGMAVGTQLFAITDGKVVDVSFDKSYGNKVVIEYIVNGIKYQDWYCHLTNAEVAKGATIKAGQAIAKSGNTGNSTGPHLHLETRVAPFRYGNDVAHPVLDIAGIIDPNAPADRKINILQKVVATVKPQTATKVVNLAELLAGQADDITLVQSALNEVIKANIKVTGKYDAPTTAAYKKWQESLGYKGNDADGKAGKTSLAKLGNRYGFSVI
jgi:murein DD-endopeptidase MepM/ murein hydrolase activator NlpD